MLFETERIKLRKMQREDIEVYNRWSNDEEVVRNTYPNIDRYSIEDTEKFYNKVVNSSSSKTYIIEDANNGNDIGITHYLILFFSIEMLNS